jgi:hypothetical protein
MTTEEIRRLIEDSGLSVDKIGDLIAKSMDVVLDDYKDKIEASLDGIKSVASEVEGHLQDFVKSREKFHLVNASDSLRGLQEEISGLIEIIEKLKSESDMEIPSTEEEPGESEPEEIGMGGEEPEFPEEGEGEGIEEPESNLDKEV